MSAGSIELRITTEGDCCCGIPYPSDNPPHDHWHHIECAWGRIEHPDPRPDRGEVGHLVLATGWIVGANLKGGPSYTLRGVDRAGRLLYQRYESSSCDDRIFIHTEYPLYHEDGLRFEDGSERPATGSQRWTWELFPAHFADGRGPDDIFVGRWPD